MIHTNRIVTVGEQESVIDRPIVLYRGDREVEIEFTLVGNEFMFSTEGNVIKSTNASHGQLVLNTPSGENMFSALAECHDGKVVFVVTKEMIDELIETGFYSFQVRLYDSEEMRSRVTIPPVMNGFDIRNPIAAEDETNVVDAGLVDYSRIVKDQSNEEIPTFDWNGNYNKTDWEHHDVITENKMNKIEDAIYSFNDKLLNSDITYMKKIKDMETKHQNDVNSLNTKDKQLGDEIDEVNRTINNRIDKLEVDVNVGDVAWKNEVEERVRGPLEGIGLYASNEAELIKAINSSQWNKTIYLAHGRVYNITEKIVFQSDKGRVHIQGNNATLQFINTDGGLDLSANTVNNGNHVLENIYIVGTNKQYPDSNDDMNNTGIGIKLTNNIGVVLKNVNVRCFEVGLSIENGINTHVLGDSSFTFNRRGIVLSGCSNTNKFFGTRIRENRQIGVHFDSGTAPYPTANCFYGCYIESNIPYNTSYPIEGVGVMLARGYDNIFDGVYSENHPAAICIKSFSNGNKFISYRLNRNNAGNETIIFDGDQIYNNRFVNCCAAVDDTQSSVNIDGMQTHSGNSFENCVGFNFNNIYNTIEVLNCGTLNGVLKNIGNLIVPTVGVKTFININGEDEPGNYDSNAKTLNVFGLSSLMIGSNVSSDITINSFTKARKNSFLCITNHQTNAKVTFTSLSRTSSMILNNDQTCVLSNYGDFIMFYINNLGRAIEINRNLSNQPIIKKGIVTYDFTSTIGSHLSKTFTLDINGVGAYASISVNFTAPLPDGLVYEVTNNGANSIKIKFVNATSSSISLGTRSFVYCYIN